MLPSSRAAPAVGPLASFLGAQKVLLVWAEGSRAALSLKGWAISADGEHFATREGMVDATSPAYQQQVDDFLRQLVQLEPTSPGEAEVSAAGEEGQQQQGEELSLGLDLSEGGEESADQAAESETGQLETTETTTAETETVATGAGPDSEVPGQEEQAQGAEQVVERTPARQPEQEKAAAGWWPDDWYSKWWFWTAVGVVAAGAATGTYFLVSSGSSGGGLVLDLH